MERNLDISSFVTIANDRSAGRPAAPRPAIPFIAKAAASLLVIYADGRDITILPNINNTRHVYHIEPLKLAPNEVVRIPAIDFIAFVGYPAVTLKANGMVVYDGSDINQVMLIPTGPGIRAYSQITIEGECARRDGHPGCGVFVGVFGDIMRAVMSSSRLARAFDDTENPLMVGNVDEVTLSDAISAINGSVSAVCVGDAMRLRDGMLQRIPKKLPVYQKMIKKALLKHLGITSRHPRASIGGAS